MTDVHPDDFPPQDDRPWSNEDDDLMGSFEAYMAEGSAAAVAFDTLADDQQATKLGWALRRRRQRLNDIEAMRQWQTSQIDAWAARESARPQADADRIETLLLAYVRARYESDQTRRIALPSVTLTATKGRPSKPVTDEEALRAWLTEHDAEALSSPPVFIPKPLVSQLAPGRGYNVKDGRVIASTGEVVPGVEAVVGDTKYEADTVTEAGDE